MQVLATRCQTLPVALGVRAMTRKPYVVDLSDLGTEMLSLGGTFMPGDIDFSDDDVRQSEGLDWSLSVELEGGAVRVVGQLRTAIQLTCVRCVEPIDRGLQRKFDLFFEPREAELFRKNDEVELADVDTSTAFMAGTELLLDEIVHEQVLLAVPMKPLCKEDCKGLCATCGRNLNTGECDCQRRPVDSAFAPLMEFKKKLENRKGPSH